jgi:arylsulfatase A-like enzyme
MPAGLTRRDFLKTSAAAAAGRLDPSQTDGPRNLVFLIADQHSGLALGCNGRPIVRTPRLDALARQGALFTHSYCAGTTCAPSRASIHTGLHVHAHGVRENGVLLPDDCISIWSILEKHGYKLNDVPRKGLYNLGPYFKWLADLGYSDVASPIIGSKQKARLIPTPYRYAVGRAGLALDHSQDAFTVRNAMRFLDENRDRRFCLWVRLFGAHDPWVVPEPYDTMYRPSDLPLPPYRQGEFDSKPGQQKRTWVGTGAARLTDDQVRLILAHYLGMVSYTDMLVGRLLDKLQDLKLESDTVVIYTADHGDTMGQHRIFTKGFALYEPAMRVPLIIRAPSDFPRGARIDAAVSGIDLLPTMLDLMNLPAERDLHGQSLVPLWRGTTRSVRQQVFAGQGFEGFDRLVMMRTPEWKLTRYDEGGGELYDMRNDPHELNNLIAEPKYSSIRQQLTRQMEDWDRGSFHAAPRFPAGMQSEEIERIKQAYSAWMKKKG